MINQAEIDAIATMVRRNGNTEGAARLLAAMVADARKGTMTTRREVFRARRFFLGV